MDNNTVITTAVVIIAALLVAAAAWLLMRRRRTDALRARFGPEYDRVLQSSKTLTDAERDLEQRQKRVAGFSLRSLSREDAQRFAASWKSVQARFVDEPPMAVVEADRLIEDVMRTRGYPVEDHDRRLEDLSVDHGHVIDHYRAGRAIVVRHEQGSASTEDLRQAMVHFRALFDELVGHERADVRRAS
jgi:hypothetical protein